MKITAHVPTQQYGYIELADLPDEPAEVERLYNKYAEKPIKLPGSLGKKIECFVGESIYYDDASHTYTNEAGEVYLSSTTHAQTFAKPFDKLKIAEAMGKKFKVDPFQVIEMWELKAKISRNLGSSLHEAIELRRRFAKLSQAIGKETHIHLSPMVKEPVEQLMKLLPIGDEVCEAVVVNHETKRAGRIDLISIKATTTATPQECDIIDFKTGELGDKMEQYSEQLKFTKEIMEAGKWKVNNLIIYHWNGSWSKEVL